MNRVSIEGSYEPVEVDLWGHTFETRDLSRKDEKKVEELQALAEQTDDEDEGFELVAKMLDLKLVPVSENGSRAQKASTILKRKWKAEELGSRQLVRFIENVDRAEDQARPT